MSDAFAVPELTRGLRSFASPRAWRSEHDQFFAPLLDARRAAARATRWPARVAAFDAERIEATMRSVLGTFASDQYPNSAPDRRAVAAQLEDACAEVFAALGRLGIASAAVQAAQTDDDRAGKWEAWVAALAATFAAADRDWRRRSAAPAGHPAGRGWLMIVGIGVNIVDINRVRRMLDSYGDRILNRLCTSGEAVYVRGRANEAQHLAVRVAAKEAAFKALAGTAEARVIGWSEIEVISADDGPPRLAFHGRAQNRAGELGVSRAWLSLSHGDATAVAMVVLEAP